MIRYSQPPKSLFINNRQRLYEKCGRNVLYVFLSADQVVRNGDQYYPYRQNSDTFYFSGLEQEKTILLFSPGHPNSSMHEHAFILPFDKKTEIWQGHKYTPDEVREISGIKNVYYLEDFEKIFSMLCQDCAKVLIPLIFNQRCNTTCENPSVRWHDSIKVKFPELIIQDNTNELAALRTVKSLPEQEMIKKACHITSNAFKETLSGIIPNMYEYQVEALLTYHFLNQGANGHAYAPIVASGKNACVLHYNTNHVRCENGDLLLMDFGAEYGNYSADCSRTIPVNGKFSPRQILVYNAVLDVLKQIKQEFVPGQTINGINQLTDKLIEEKLLELQLISKEDIKNQDPKNPVCKKFFPHGTSHFMGLDVHDVGSKDLPFETGMVLTCEPGIYIPEENLGVRIENDILVADKPIDLMADIPIEAKEIERLMAEKKE